MDSAGRELEPGAALGEFRLSRRLGRGGMGVVWLAEQPALGRSVALKILHGEYAATPQFVERFRREALHAAKLRHPAIVSVFTAGQHGDLLYLAMDYIDGSPLDQVVARMRGRAGLPSLSEIHAAVRIAIRIGEALEYAHSEGVLHRDVKPGNILMDRAGRSYLSDFGLSRSLDDPRLTQSGVLLGTPAYMAPEQIDPRVGDVDARTDVYSLAATLFELVTLKAILTGTEIRDLVARLVLDPPRASSVNPAVPTSLDRLLARSLAREPADRTATAGEFVGELRWIRERYLAPQAGAVRGPDDVLDAPTIVESQEISRPGDFPGAGAADHPSRRWMQRVPGGALAVALGGLVAAAAWQYCCSRVDLPRDLVVVGFPLAWVVWLAARPRDHRGLERTAALALRALAFLGMVAYVALREEPYGRLEGPDTFAGLLAVASFLLFDRWLATGDRTCLAAMVLPFLAACGLSSARHPTPWWNVLWFHEGYHALFSFTGMLAIFPEFLLPRPRRVVVRYAIRAVVVGVLAALAYFVTYDANRW